MVIIIGANSFIGHELYNYFSRKNGQTIGTYFSRPLEGLVHFNLKDNDIAKLGDLSLQREAIICSAIAHPDICKKNEAESYDVNVRGTEKLIGQLQDMGIFPIFLSSTYVFDGNKGNYIETDEKNPNTVYGKQKSEVEDFLLGSKKPFLALRISKAYGMIPNDGNFLSPIVEQLTRGETVRCATDQIFSPIYSGDLTKLLDFSIQNVLTGIYHAGALEALSRYQIACMVKSKLGIRNGKIEPCSLRDFKFLDNRPLNTSMDSGKITNETGYSLCRLENYLNDLRDSY